MIEIKIDKPYPKQIDFFMADTKYIAYGGSRGGGKSWAGRTKAVLLALNQPGIQILLLRRTLNELRENHTVPLIKLLNCKSKDEKEKIIIYKEQEKVFEFPNESRIKLGYCDNENDVLQYQGQAYDVIIMEEATQFTEFQFQCLTESNRASGMCKTKFRPRMYFTCNPGGVGHTWVKRLFVDREYKNKEKAENYTFIPSTVYENKFLMENDPDYVSTLENLPENRKKAMLYGDWNIFDGQYFDEFKRDIHVIEPFVIPSHWKKYIAMDYGLDMLAVLWFARDTEGNAYVYKELHESNLIISEACKRIKEINNNEEYERIYAPRDLWNRRQETGKSVADIFYENGLLLNKTSVDRVDGWMATKEWLKVIEQKNIETGELEQTSKLKIFRNCANLIKNIPQAQVDERNPNDVATEPHEITHICDALRYFCVNFTRATEVIKPKSEEEEREEKAYNSYVNFGIGGIF